MSRWMRAGGAGASRLFPILATLAVLTTLAVVAAACGSSSSSSSTTSPSPSAVGSPVRGSSITVVYHYAAPPKSMLDQFTQETGVKVNWVQVGWDNLQTKIAAAATSNTYFADLTDVDWSKVGQYYKTGWFTQLNPYFDASSLKSDMPQIDTFQANGQLLAMPFDASFTVTTVNTKLFKDAGQSTTPATVTDYTNALKAIKAKGTVANPLDIPFAAAEGLSTYWYQTTAAFGGSVLDADYNPQFTDPGSAGYKAMQWMVNAYKTGLVPKANIGVTDYQGFTSEMAQGRVASVFSDYSGTVASVYEVPSSSKVVGQVQYIPTPGTGSGTVPNLANPDGIGIPKTAKNVAGAVAFIKWFTDTQNQAIWGGLNGSKDVISGFPLPARLSSMQLLAKSGKVAGSQELLTLLKTSRAQFPGPGAPPWYAQFSNAVYTNIHQAASGSETVQQAVTNIANQVSSLKASQ